MSEPVPKRSRALAQSSPDASFESRYPHISSWVKDAWVEIGHDDCGRAFVRALDIGGLIWEGTGPYPSMDEALRALDRGIGAWIARHG